MSDRRSIVEEILAIQRRRKTDSPQTELLLRLLHVEVAFENRDRKNKELLRYFPIALVACIESFFRMAIKRLIDSGDPYLSNAQGLLARTNVTFEILKAFHGQSLKVGDVIGHSVHLSNLALIENNMGQLMGINFLNQISSIHDRWAVEVHGKPKTPIIPDAASTFRYVTKTFELRHIFCHETANGFDFNPDDIDNCFNHSVLFLKASDELISGALYPNAPLTQSDITAASAEEYRTEKQRLDELVAKATGGYLTAKQAERFREAIKAWQTFCEGIAEVEGLAYEGGSIRPSIEYAAATRLTKERADDIANLLKTLAKE